jgi:hypothetical protein
MVPDTLDMEERTRLAIHAMTEATDPLADREPYYLVYFRTNPPLMVHCSWHGSALPKFMEAVALMRIVSGSDQNLQVDHKWMEVALKSQGPDGLIYTPTRGRPWADWSAYIDEPIRRGRKDVPYLKDTIEGAQPRGGPVDFALRQWTHAQHDVTVRNARWRPAVARFGAAIGGRAH